MVISIQELRKMEEEHRKQDEARQPRMRFPWQEGYENQPQGVLKFARFLYGE